MKSGKHIVILTPGFAENESDENCIPPIQGFIKTYQQLYPEDTFSVIAFQYPFIEEFYQWHGVDVYAIGGQNKKSFSRIITWYKVVSTFRKIRSKHPNPIIHSLWLTECFFVGTLISKLYGVKLLATVMGQDAKKSNAYLQLFTTKKASIICCSEFAAKILKEQHNLSCAEIIPFGIPKDEILKTNNTPNRSIDIIGIGNLGPIKRYDIFVDIIHHLKKTFPTVYSEIVGKGEFGLALQKKIKEQKLEMNLVMTGELKRSEVLAKTRHAKILLHTSSYEGQGYIYLEALACGAYVVSFDKGFLPVSHKVKTCGSEEEMCQAIQEILQNGQDFNPVIPVTMEETVQKYKQQYDC